MQATGSPSRRPIRKAPGSAAWKASASVLPGFQPSSAAHSAMRATSSALATLISKLIPDAAIATSTRRSHRFFSPPQQVAARPLAMQLSAALAATVVKLVAPPVDDRLAPRHRPETGKNRLLRRLATAAGKNCSPAAAGRGSRKVLPSYSRRKRPRRCSSGTTLSTKSSSPPGRYGNMTLKPSLASVTSHSSI